MTYSSTMLEDLEFSQDNFPSIIVNDGSIETLDQARAWIGENLAILKKELSCTGALLFRGFPVNDAVSYDSFFSAFEYKNLPMRSHCQTQFGLTIPIRYLVPMKRPSMWRYIFITRWLRHLFSPVLSLCFVRKLPTVAAQLSYADQMLCTKKLPLPSLS